MRRPTSICSLNCEGLINARSFIYQFLETHNCDILLLQETWLLEANIDILNSVHPDFLATGKSGADERRCILPGRPPGGVAILYRKNFAKIISPVACNSRRMCGVLCRPVYRDSRC